VSWATKPRLRRLRIASHVALLLTALPACRPSPSGAVPAKSDGAGRPKAGQCDGPPALAVTPLVVDAMNGGEPLELVLGQDGTVRFKDKIVARISGACLLDPGGGVLRSVDGHAVVSGRQGELAGAFQRRATWIDMYGKPVPAGEVLVQIGGTTLGVIPDGSLYMSQPREPAVQITTSIHGDVARARRTALVLLDALWLLDVP
jgi:hypothetical protein